jgi:hypothetical protein
LIDQNIIAFIKNIGHITPEQVKDRHLKPHDDCAKDSEDNQCFIGFIGESKKLKKGCHFFLFLLFFVAIDHFIAIQSGFSGKVAFGRSHFPEKKSL